jgi:hypothetical protein
MIKPREVDKPLVLYGDGKLSHLAQEIFAELKIPVREIITHRDIQSTPSPVLPDALVAVCVAKDFYSKICHSLKIAGWYDIVPVWDIVEAYPEIGLHNGWMAPRLSTEEYCCSLSVSASLYDKVSQDHYGAHYHWRKNHNEHRMHPDPFHSALPSTLADIRHRQRVDVYADTPMKRISIHNEGCELMTIVQNLHLLVKYRPMIDVAVYHSRDGLWEIEKTLMDNLKDYRFEFRLHAFMGQAAIMYCTPNERIGNEKV